MSFPDPERLAALVAEAAREASTVLAIAGALERVARDSDDDEALRALICAFHYHYLDRRVPEQRRQHGVFGPMLEWEAGQYPPPLSEVPEAWSTLWAEVADMSEAPLVVSRLNDLLWELKAGDRPDQRAGRAVGAYLDLRYSQEPMVAPDALTRALEISRALGDTAQVTAVTHLIVKHVQTELDGQELHAGVSFTLIESLAELPADSRPDALDDLIERAKQRYGDDPYNVQAAVELQVALSGDEPERRRALHSEAVARFKRAADEAEGILRVAHLQHAIELARAYGLRSEMQDLRRELQEIGTDELDLKEISTEIALPSEQLDQLIDEIAAGERWADCLGRLVGIYGPPTGRHEANVAFVEELKTRSPLQFLFPSVRLGPENTVVRELRTQDERTDAALVEHERMRILIWSLIATQSLMRIRDRLGPPSEDDVAAFFEGSLIPPDLATQIAHGVVLFTQGSFDDSAHSLAPRIERAVREISRRAGLVVSREPIGPDPGGVRPLGLLLAQLEGVLDESWRRYLMNTLTEVLGVNLRNRISHGLIGEAQAQDAALLIHVAAFLGTRRIGERKEDEVPGDGGEPGVGRSSP